MTYYLSYSLIPTVEKLIHLLLKKHTTCANLLNYTVLERKLTQDYALNFALLPSE